jgi:hypothetical protein
MTANDLLIAAKASLPKAIAQDDNVRLIRLAIIRRKSPSHNRVHAEY